MTKVNPEKFVAICEKLGLSVLKQPSQYKITGKDPGKKFYIPGTKAVSKVELSGFTHDLAVAWDDVYPGKKSPSGKITQVLNFDQPEKLILKDFFKIAKSLVVASSKPAPKPEVDKEDEQVETAEAESQEAGSSSQAAADAS